MSVPGRNKTCHTTRLHSLPLHIPLPSTSFHFTFVLLFSPVLARESALWAAPLHPRRPGLFPAVIVIQASLVP